MSTLPSQSFQCSHCVLIFKSKFFLWEHLSNVHGLSVDTELPSLKTNTPSSNLKHNTNSDDSGGSLACRHCTFTASNWDVVDKHEKTFHQKSIKKVEPLQIQKRYLKGKLHIIRRPGIKVVATSNKTKKNAVNKMSRPQHEDETGAKVNSSTSKAKCISNSSTDLKTYKRPSGPITKYLVPSVSMVKYSPTSVKLPDPPKLSGISKETLILHNPHLSTAQNSTGVLKVAATSQNDLCVRHNVHISENARVVNDLFVRERLMVGSLVEGSVSTEIGKRAHEDISVSPPKKRLKTDVGVKKSRESSSKVEAKLSCSSNIAFEVSEDEDEGDNLIHELDGKVDVVNVDHSLMYSCKHCRHGDMVADDVLTHYEKVHPYIRCSSAYMKDPHDRTARFRCLECPVEYPYVADLRLHYRVGHPGAPDVFQMQSHALCFKCFVCPFTTLLSESLKDHYQKQHPSHIVMNPLIYCKFNASILKKEMSLSGATTPDKEMAPMEMSQADACEKKIILKTPDQGSLKSATTPDKEMAPVEMSQVNTCEKTPSPKTADQGSFNSAATLHRNSEASPPEKETGSQGVDRELHQCKNCAFTHLSAVAMLVHYQRNHPERGMSIDQIKMAHIKSQTQAPLSPERNSESSASMSSTNTSLVSPQTRFSDSLKEAKDKTELSHQKAIPDSQVKPEDTPAISPPKVSGPFQSKCRESPGKCVILSDVDPKEVDKLFFCQVCNYSDPTVRGIWSHQRARHGITQRNSEEIHLHTAAIRSRCKTSAVTICPPQKIADTFAEIPSSFSSAQPEMFYCHLCDYYNPTMKGIIGHLNWQHVGHAVTTVEILMYSAKVNKEKAQHKAMASASSSDLNASNWPEADNPSGKHENDATGPTNLSTPGADLIFCQHCHYGSLTVRAVLNHQAGKHSRLKRSADQILRCTSMIRRKIQESSASQTKNLALTSSGLPLPIIEEGEEEMLFCHLCNFRHTMSRMREHYKIVHPKVITTHKEIISYSLGVHERISASSSYSKASNLGEAGIPEGKHENEVINPMTPGLFFCQKCNYGNPMAKNVLSHQTKRHHTLKSSIDEILRYTTMIKELNSPTKNLALTSTGLPLPIIEEGEEEMLFCHLCNYKHTMSRMKEHYKLVHPKVITTHEEIVSYSLGVHERISASSSYSKASNWGEAGIPVGKHENDVIYPMTPGLFFCQKCNYGHPLAKSVLSHQTKRHRTLKSSIDEILRYTTMIKELNSPTNNLAVTSTGLPLPIIEEGDEEMLFCHVCNFSHKLLTHIIYHFKKAHPEVITTDEEVVSYSLSVHERMERISQMGMPAEQVGKCTPIVHGGNEEAHTASFPSSVSKNSALTRSLRCHKCTYCISHIYLLKRHLSKKHNLKFTVPQILSNAFKDGSLPAGYHCEWCVFSDKSAANVYRHCQKKHTLKNISLKHIAMRLYAGPTVSSLKKRSSLEKKKPSQQSGKNETKIYPCRSCSFKGSSLESISSHYREVHPWPIKDHHEFDMPTGFSLSFQCPFCPAVFYKRHGLNTHLGVKHPEYQTPLSEDEKECEKEYEKEDELDSNECTDGFNVYKCPRCAYVNTGLRPILTHCQMKHPTFKARADIIQMTKVQFPNLKECCGQRRRQKKTFKSLQLGGYMCRICPVTRGSIEKLKIHYDQDHNQTAPNLLKPAPKQSTVIKNQLLSKYRSMQSSALQATSFKNKMPGGLKCNLCKHVAVTKIGLSRHLNRHHKKESEAGNTSYYACTLCPYSTQVQEYLGKHYKRIHGIAAFLTFYAKVYNIRTYRRNPKILTRGSSTPAMDDGKKYKCQLCAYSGLHLRYLRSHYVNVHGHAALHAYLPPLNKKRQATQLREAEDGKAPEAQSEANAPVQCKKCNRTFRLAEFLALHFTHFHREDFRADFTMLNSKNYTNQEGKWYQCGLCRLKIRGTKKLCSHLDDHRRLCMEKANAVEMTTPVDSRKQPLTQPLKVKRQEELQEFETIEDLAKWNMTKVETVTLAASPPPLSSPTSSPSSASKTEEQQTRTRGTEPHNCKECGRTFMSLGGLKVHENSHATMSDLQRVDTLHISDSFDTYISYRQGTSKPFHCDLCAYRTDHLGLARSHLVKKHGAEFQDISSGVDVTVNQAETKPAAEEPRPPVDLQEDNCWSEPPDEPEFAEKPVYSEPPEVQRQLGHYKLKRQASVSAPDPVPQETSPPEDGLLCCEFCNFSSGHMSSIRRHYLNRHNGKRLLRCKDCSFFTGSRKTLEKHIELGHSNCPSEPTHQKDLRCPLCLYQSKNKNNMIDHVMLHREERVIPIEVRRPKLSRYLEGIVFRCHKCTFTSSSDENLRLHALKHDDLKPYKCRLCYFDCTLLSDLEAHLCDKHQVVRNHELVGQINVDLLEARKEVQKKKAVEDATKQISILHEHHPEDSPSDQCNGEDSPSEQCNREPSEECKEDGTVHSNVPVKGSFLGTVPSSRTVIITIVRKPELDSAVNQRHEQEDTTNGVGTEHVDLNTCAPQKGGTGEEDETCNDEEFDDKSPDGPFLSCEEDEQGETDEELVDAYEELPILDSKCQKDEVYQHGSQGRVFQMDKSSGSPVRAQQERLNETIHGEHSYALPEQEGEEKDEDLCSAPELDGDDSTAAGDVVCGVVMEEVFVCTLCGRYLNSGAELERHVVQHGL